MPNVRHRRDYVFFFQWIKLSIKCMRDKPLIFVTVKICGLELLLCESESNYFPSELFSCDYE